MIYDQEQDTTVEPEVFDPKPELDRFLKRVNESRLRDAALTKWHIDLFLASEGKIDLPYNGDDVWLYVNVGSYEKNEETNEWGMVYDHTATMDKLAAVAKYAAIVEGVSVEKKYDEESFELVIKLPVKGLEDPVKLTYMAKREVVCERKVVGTRVVPATTTPERVEDVVEWECKPVSLLGWGSDNA